MKVKLTLKISKDLFCNYSKIFCIQLGNKFNNHNFVLLISIIFFCRMLSRQFARNAQLRIITTRYFTRSSIIREINKDKIPAKTSNETKKETDNVIGNEFTKK